jgi:nicotinic acid mononucleotide adenylyltransferase
MEITLWREWERVLELTSHIVVTRPGIEIGFSHVGSEIAANIVDLRGRSNAKAQSGKNDTIGNKKILITDAVNIEVSATDIRRKIRQGDPSWRDDVPHEVAKYIEKYQIYS